MFYVLYAVVAVALHTADIDPQAFKSLDMGIFDEAKIAQAAELVNKLYEELGGNNKVAKGAELLEQVRAKVAE